MRLTVFDQSPAAEGRPQAEAIRDSLDLARAAEAMGYHRYWVSEHHHNASLVGVAPEILAAAVAARTSRIRVGTAGVLLPYYAPFKVAEQFRVLDAVAPGRIDLGIGRSPGGQGQEAALGAALRPEGGTPAPHIERVRELLHWLHDESDPPHGVRAFPRGDTDPQVWLLGGSLNGARMAAELGLPFAFNYSNGMLPDGAEAPLARYREDYRPSARYPEPRLMLLVWTLAAADEAQAMRLFYSRANWRLQMRRGERAPLTAPPTSGDPFAGLGRATLDSVLERHVIGEAGDVAGRLTALASQYGADELALSTWTHDPAARTESFRLLAGVLSA